MLLRKFVESSRGITIYIENFVNNWKVEVIAEYHVEVDFMRTDSQDGELYCENNE
jgi:hypothetical protein